MGHDDYTVNEVYDLTGGTCFYCGKSLSFRNYGRVGEKGAWEVDHFIPYASRGAHEISNWVPACIDCNTRKSDLMPWEFDPERFDVGERDPMRYV